MVDRLLAVAGGGVAPFDGDLDDLSARARRATWQNDAPPLAKNPWAVPTAPRRSPVGVELAPASPLAEAERAGRAPEEIASIEPDACGGALARDPAKAAASARRARTRSQRLPAPKTIGSLRVRHSRRR